jgi:UDP-sulfoquinovose synthase
MLGYDVALEHCDNPRVEAEDHHYHAANAKLLALGLTPHLLGDELVRSMLGAIARHQDRVIAREIMPRTRWAPLPEPDPTMP